MALRLVYRAGALRAVYSLNRDFQQRRRLPVVEMDNRRISKIRGEPVEEAPAVAC